jgi:hypothetical protein
MSQALPDCHLVLTRWLDAGDGPSRPDHDDRRGERALMHPEHPPKCKLNSSALPAPTFGSRHTSSASTIKVGASIKSP